jgi:hypothetical protein
MVIGLSDGDLFVVFEREVVATIDGEFLMLSRVMRDRPCFFNILYQLMLYGP